MLDHLDLCFFGLNRQLRKSTKFYFWANPDLLCYQTKVIPSLEILEALTPQVAEINIHGNFVFSTFSDL
jgi:hypothetical protein